MNRRRMPRCIALPLVLAAGIGGLSQAAHAQTSWTNSGAGDWFNPGNWDAGVPTAADQASVNNGGTANAGGLLAPTAGTLRVGAGAGTVAGTVNVTGLDLVLGVAGQPLQVGNATNAAGLAVGALTVDGSVRGVTPGSSFGNFRIGTANGAGAGAEGTVGVGGDVLAAGGGFVGVAFNGATSATGSLTVGGTLTGLDTVGEAVNLPGGTASVAVGRVTVVTGDLTLGAFGITVGQAFGAGTEASGTASVEAATLRSTASAFGSPFWLIGNASQGTASGSVLAQGVDTSAQAISGLVVGVAANGGTATGELRLGSGDLVVAGTAAIGSTGADNGGTSSGTVVLGGALQAEGANRFLDVGQVTSGSIFAPGQGSATGSLEAAGVSGFRNVDIGRAAAHIGLDITGTGSATLGAGGLVNATDPGGTLRIGTAEGLFNNGAIVGPGPVAMGNATVGGDISGYQSVAVGTVAQTGTAVGTLDLAGGTLTTGFLQVGSVNRNAGSSAISDGATNATGRLTVTDGAIAMVSPFPGGAGLTRIGAIQASDNTIPDSAQGELALTRSSFTGGFLLVGFGGAGTVSAIEGSSIEIVALTVGSNGGTGTLVLDGSTLAVRADPTVGGTGAMSVGVSGGSGSVTATSSAITVDGNLGIGSTATPNGGATASMALQGSALAVGGNIAIGDFWPTNRAELALSGSTAEVGGDVRVSRSANIGALFGEALLALDASLLEIQGELVMDFGAELLFGIDGLARGQDGYGAIDAAFARLAGVITVDFAGLFDDLGFSSADFDLIAAANGFLGDFATVSFLNLPTGYFATFGFATDGEGDVWRVTLTQAIQEVPAPGALGVLLAGIAALCVARRRRPG